MGQITKQREALLMLNELFLYPDADAPLSSAIIARADYELLVEALRESLPSSAPLTGETPETDALDADVRLLPPDMQRAPLLAHAKQLERRAEYWRAKCHKAWEDGDEQTRQRMQADAEAALMTDEVEETMKRLRSQIPGCDCDNPAQCWEPCGTLGHSEKHIKVVKE